MNVVSTTGINGNTAALRSYAAWVWRERPDCFLLAGTASPIAVALTRAVHAASPTAKIFAPGSMCTAAWTNPRDGGVPAGIDRLIECTAVTRSLAAYPGGRSFMAAYNAKYRGTDPGPYAILGYEAMKLGLSTIAGLGSDGDSKSAVPSALFSATHRRSVLGTYGFDKDGDTTLRSYGLYKVAPGGDPSFVRTATPPHVL